MAFSRTIKKGLKNVSDKVTSQMASRIKEETKHIINDVEKRAIMLGEDLLKKLVGMLLIGTGIIFLALTVFYFLREYLNLTNTISFLIVGIIIIIIGWIMKSSGNLERRRYYG